MGLRERKAAETKVRLAFAAIDLFKEKTLDDISVSELCAAMNISEGTFFNYYPKKNDLILYITQLITIDLIHEAGVRSSGSHLEFIEGLFERVADLVVEHPWGMHEIFGHQTLMRVPPQLPRVTALERQTAYPHIKEPIEKDMPATVIELVGQRFQAAMAAGEIPEVDLEAATIGHYAIFFAVPIALTWDDPTRVRHEYRRLLRTLWRGLGFPGNRTTRMGSEVPDPGSHVGGTR